MRGNFQISRSNLAHPKIMDKSPIGRNIETNSRDNTSSNLISGYNFNKTPTTPCKNIEQTPEVSAQAAADLHSNFDEKDEHVKQAHKSEASGEIPNLQDKLEAIRRNKALLERKIKEYEDKLTNSN